MADHHGFDLWVTSLRGVSSARVAETFLRLMSNQTPKEWEVGRAGGMGIVRALRATIAWCQSVSPQLGLGGGREKVVRQNVREWGYHLSQLRAEGWTTQQNRA